MIQSGNRLVDRVVVGRRWAAARETDSTRGTGWWLWIVEGVGESRSPDMSSVIYCFAGKQNCAYSPMAEITRDNAKCVLSREERRDDFPESSFRLTIYRTDEDGNDRYIQPTRMVSLETHSRNRILTLGTPSARKAGAFQYCAHLCRSLFPYR